MAMCSGSCQGGCSVAYTNPSCVGTVTPPSCNASAQCQASCQSQANASAMCTPPSVSLSCQGSASAQVTALVNTVSKNFPAIISAIQVQGPLAVQAAGNVVTAGTSLGADAVGCAGEIAGAASASASVSVSFSASASVSGSAGGPMPSM